MKHVAAWAALTKLTAYLGIAGSKRLCSVVLERHPLFYHDAALL